MKKGLVFGLLIFLLFLAAQTHRQQNPKPVPISYLKKLIQEDSLTQAEKFLRQNTDYYFAAKGYDSLVAHIDIAGSLILNKNNATQALQRATDLAERLKISKDPYITKQALSEVAWLHTEYGNPQKANEILFEILKQAAQIKDPVKRGLHYAEHSLGNNYYDLGEYEVSKSHYQKALKYLLRDDAENYGSLQATYNSLGRAMWMESKLDSAKYYFEEALLVLAKTDTTDLRNHEFRPALLYSNLAVLVNAQGKSRQAIDYTHKAIDHYETYIQKINDDALAGQARKNQLICVDNLASYYAEWGELSRALELLNFSFRKKQELFKSSELDHTISLILIAETQVANLDFIEAVKTTERALSLIHRQPDFNAAWHGSLLLTRAEALDAQGKTEAAQRVYDEAEILLRQANQGTYNLDFLNQLTRLSLFYAKIQNKTRATHLANEVYRFAKNSDFKHTLQNFRYTTHRAEVAYLLKEHKEAIRYATEAVDFILHLSGTNHAADSVFVRYQLPKALLLRAQAELALLDQPTLEDLQRVHTQLQPALELLEQREQALTEKADIQREKKESEAFYSFYKKLLLDLYEKTGDPKYLEKTISLHESGIYRQIRTQLKMRDEMRFAHLPDKVLQREAQLRRQSEDALSGEKTNLDRYFQLRKEWKNHLDSLRHQHPEYYRLRYATETLDFNQLKKIPDGQTTIIRYLFIDQQLYALVLTQNMTQWIPLNAADTRQALAEFKVDRSPTPQYFQHLHQLYQNLWAPLEKYIHSQKVVIIPDGELFNLSFELLTPQSVTSLEDFDFEKNSLLGKHSISYNYSLSTLIPVSKKRKYQSNFVAFTPGFDEQMKGDYLLAVKDSTRLDQAYLKLLPQPFSKKLSQKFAQFFRGKQFTREKATREAFTQNAKNHRIIHIGTHAETHNNQPDLSKIIFSKSLNPTAESDENMLYAYEIYQLDLPSELAVLTACETGKPTYQPGEGMISLAHAFNYAGSRSMLTGLWKIDEKSSTAIIDKFYHNLAEGMTKDVALQQAKLAYLQSERGRTLSPQYWAGLILIGDMAPMELAATSSGLFFRVLIGVTLLLLTLWLVVTFRRKYFGKD